MSSSGTPVPGGSGPDPQPPNDGIQIARIVRQGTVVAALIAAVSAVIVVIVSSNSKNDGGQTIAVPSTSSLSTETPTATPTVLPSTPASTDLITSPANGEQVPMVITATGVARDVTAGNQLWIFVEFADGPFFPSHVTQSGDRWSAPDLYVGGPAQAGGQFTLHLIELNTAAQVKLDEYFTQEREVLERGGNSPGLPRSDLEGWRAKFLAQVDVTRR